MAQHERNNSADERRRAEQLNQHASRASALLSDRAAARKAQQGFAPRQPLQQPNLPEQPQQPAQVYPKNLGDYVRQNIVYIGSVVAVVLIVTAGILAARAVLFPDADEVAEEEVGYVSPYDWTKLDNTDGRYRYIVDGQVKSRLGVDVSDHQHEIDWEAVAADGIDFAMARVGYRGATEGKLYLDEQFWNNLDGARDAGLDCGVYFFSQAQTVEEAREEADYVLTYLNGTPLEYPIAFDSEEKVLDLESSRTTGLSGDEMTAIAEAFCARVEAAGYRSCVYGNMRDLARYRYDSLQDRTIWWAEYGVVQPHANIDIALWQYASDGQVDGIDTTVDMNIDLSGALE